MSEALNRKLSAEELDTIGEIMNISMGSAATAISGMLERQVIITTPRMEQEQYRNIDSSGVEPALIVKIRYTQGIEGTNTTMLKRQDMQIILDILMGNEVPTAPDEFEFDDMSMSAACEIMNQMMGASATALSEILETTINISTPEALLVESTKDIEEAYLGIRGDDPVVAISFNMSIKDVLNTTFITFLPITLALRIINHVNMGVVEEDSGEADSVSVPAPKKSEGPAAQQVISPREEPEQKTEIPLANQAVADKQTQQSVQGDWNAQQPGWNMQQMQPPGWNIPPQQMAYAAGYPQYDPYLAQQQALAQGQGYYGIPPQQQAQGGFTPPPVTVKKAEFPDFSQQAMRAPMPAPSNMGLLMGVQLEVSVIIGKTKRKIKDIMDFGQGTVIELDKQTGAPAEIMVNGQLLAYGDVIVVGDNFGVRITEIVGSKELVDLLGNG